MKNVITNITISEDITLVSLNNVPGNTTFIAGFFKEVADNHINVDMITMSASQGSSVIVSFTAEDNYLTDILSVTGRFKKNCPALRTDVNSGNFKVSFYGENMKYLPGVAASIFHFFAAEGIDIKLITTSEVDVSCLFDRMSSESVFSLLKKEFNKTL